MAHWPTTATRFCKTILANTCPTYCQVELSQAHHNQWRIDSPNAYCHRCGASMGVGGVTAAGCAFCVSAPISWHQTVRLAPYTDPVQRWIVSMKFSGAWCWANWFGRELARVVTSPPDSKPVVVCPVPMHWARQIGRGYNQAHLIGSALARDRRWPLARLLKRTRYTPPQTAVGPSRRAANVRQSFAIKCVDLTGWHVWLVDDVKTSGATLNACARLLRRAGARQVNAAVVAVAHPR